MDSFSELMFSVSWLLWWGAALAYAYCVMFDKANFLPEDTVPALAQRLPGVPIPFLRLLVYGAVFEAARVIFDIWWRVTDLKIVVAFALFIVVYSGQSLFVRVKRQRPQAPGLRKRAE